jgi:hypothetical protein
LSLCVLMLAEGLEPLADVLTNALSALGLGCLIVTLHRIAPQRPKSKRLVNTTRTTNRLLGTRQIGKIVTNIVRIGLLG